MQFRDDYYTFYINAELILYNVNSVKYKFVPTYIAPIELQLRIDVELDFDCSWIGPGLELLWQTYEQRTKKKRIGIEDFIRISNGLQKQDLVMVK